MHYVAKVYVSLKPTVNDPQGLTVLGGLKNLGFEGVTGVRVGKYLEVFLEAEAADEAEAAVKEMCRRLLANPVIEQSRFDVEEVSAGVSVSP